MEEVLKWYAIRVFWNRTEAVKDMLEERGLEYYAQTLMPAYIFIHTTLQCINLLRQTEYNRFYVYIDRVTRVPLPIPDREVEIFRIVTSAGASGFGIYQAHPQGPQAGGHDLRRRRHSHRPHSHGITGKGSAVARVLPEG